MKSHPPDHAENDVLPDDIIYALSAAVAAVEPNPGQARALRARLEEGMENSGKDEQSSYFTLAAGAGEWVNLTPLVSMKILHRDAQGVSFFLRLQPGAELPPHIHFADEECLVLEGELRLGEGVLLRAGDYHFAPKGLPHATARSARGATLFLRSAKPAYQL
ncbi:MAG: cupin domain-containing protein [Chromatiales bacterium]